MAKICLLVFLCVAVLCIRSLDALENGIARQSAENLIPCKEGWYLFGEKCYKIEGESERLSWEKASEQCSQKGGNLATIYSKEIRDSVFAFMLLNVASDAWIGLNDREVEGNYVWDDGSDFDYIDWEIGEPSGSRMPWEDCVLMRYWTQRSPIGRWNDYDCRSENPYVCQQAKDENYQNPDPRFCSAERGGGWKYLNSCYHIVTEKKTWRAAERHCQENFNGHLATVLDFRTEYFLNHILSNYNESFWYGIKIREETQQQWSSGWQVLFNRWEEYAPFADGTCVSRSSEYVWDRDCCSLNHSFVCETSTVKPPAEENGLCPTDEWERSNGKLCYFIETRTARTWNDADGQCRRKGGSLVNMHSKEELNNAYVFLRSYMGLRYVYIGLHRRSSNKNIFEWTDGREVTFQNWLPGEPNNIKEECGTLHMTVMRWNDLSCGVKHLYLCSAPKAPPAKPEEELNTCKLRENITEIVKSAFEKYVLPNINCNQDGSHHHH